MSNITPLYILRKYENICYPHGRIPILKFVINSWTALLSCCISDKNKKNLNKKIILQRDNYVNSLRFFHFRANGGRKVLPHAVLRLAWCCSPS